MSLREWLSLPAKVVLGMSVKRSVQDGTLLVAGLQLKPGGPIEALVVEKSQGRIHATGHEQFSLAEIDPKAIEQFAAQVRESGNDPENVVAIVLLQPRGGSVDELPAVLGAGSADRKLLRLGRSRFPNAHIELLAGNTKTGPKAFLRNAGGEEISEVDLSTDFLFR